MTMHAPLRAAAAVALIALLAALQGAHAADAAADAGQACPELALSATAPANDDSGFGGWAQFNKPGGTDYDVRGCGQGAGGQEARGRLRKRLEGWLPPAAVPARGAAGAHTDPSLAAPQAPTVCPWPHHGQHPLVTPLPPAAPTLRRG